MWLGLPLGATMLLISGNTNLPRYFIHHFIGLEEVGIFGAIAGLMMAGGTLTRALNHASSPRLAKLFAAGDLPAFRRLFSRLLCLYLALGVAGIAAAAVIGRPFLTLLFRSEYAEFLDVLMYVMVALAVAYIAGLLDMALVSIRRIRLLVPLTCITTVTMLVACSLLVPSRGLSGGGLALAISKLPLVVFGMVLLWKSTRSVAQTRPYVRMPAGESQTASSQRASRCAG